MKTTIRRFVEGAVIAGALFFPVAASANGNPVFLDEYTTSGTLVQSVAIPSAAGGSDKALVAGSGWSVNPAGK
jgi:hypothetical protein